MLNGRTEFNGAAVLEKAKLAAGSNLLRAAVTLQAEFMRRLNVSNPRPHRTPSQRGEYLRKRTGWLQGHIVYEPTAPAEVARQGSVRVGYGRSAFYGALWEIRGGRKGLADALREAFAAVKAAAAAPAPKGA